MMMSRSRYRCLLGVALGLSAMGVMILAAAAQGPEPTWTLAAELAAKAPADGYTLLLGSHTNLVLAMAAGTHLR